jgi:hypothetical protein
MVEFRQSILDGYICVRWWLRWRTLCGVRILFLLYLLGRIPLNFPIQLLIPMHVLYRRIFSSIIRQINILLLFHLTICLAKQRSSCGADLGSSNVPHWGGFRYRLASFTSAMKVFRDEEDNVNNLP